jgi:cell division protease FtsH
VYGVATTGAENDLEQVTMIARQMVMRWGMSPKLGPLSYQDGEGAQPSFQRPYSEETAALVDAEVRRIVEECLVEARALLASHRSQLDSLAKALIAEESLDEKQILTVTGISPQQVAATVASATPDPAAVAGQKTSPNI